MTDNLHTTLANTFFSMTLFIFIHFSQTFFLRVLTGIRFRSLVKAWRWAGDTTISELTYKWYIYASSGGRVTHICVSKLIIIGSDNGLSPGRRQAIIWTIAAILLIGPLELNFSEMLIKINTFSLKKMHWKYRLQDGVYFVSASMC